MKWYEYVILYICLVLLFIDGIFYLFFPEVAYKYMHDPKTRLKLFKYSLRWDWKIGYELPLTPFLRFKGVISLLGFLFLLYALLFCKRG